MRLDKVFASNQYPGASQTAANLPFEPSLLANGVASWVARGSFGTGIAARSFFARVSAKGNGAPQSNANPRFEYTGTFPVLVAGVCTTEQCGDGQVGIPPLVAGPVRIKLTIEAPKVPTEQMSLTAAQFEDQVKATIEYALASMFIGGKNPLATSTAGTAFAAPAARGESYF